jgi:hypothetical protein
METSYQIDDPNGRKPKVLSPTQIEAPPLQPNAPSAPKPGEGWVQTADGQGWLPPDRAGTPGAAGAPAAPAAPAPTAPAAPAAPAPVAGAPAAPGAPPTTVADAFKTSLITQLNRPSPTLADPALKAQSDAFSVGQTRENEAARAQLAERSAMQGGTGVNSGAFDVGISDLLERQGEKQGAFNAQLVGDEKRARDQQLLGLLGIAGNSTNAGEGRDLQRELADQDAAISREQIGLQRELGNTDAGLRSRGLDIQGSLGQGDLGLRSRLGEGQLNLGLASLLQGGDQFNRQLSQQGAQFGAGLDNQTLLALLGGLG